jgi:hypothetical protein
MPIKKRGTRASAKKTPTKRGKVGTKSRRKK